MKTIVLTGGGTAGHALPHLAIYPYIKNDFDKFYYIGSENGIEKSLMEKRFDYFSVTTTKLVRSLTFENLKILPRLLKGVRDSEIILKKIKPSLVFSKGGYVALPVVIAAKKLKIPVVTHESDYTLGLANKLIAKKCDFVLTSFESTAKGLKNAVFTGAPIREFSLNKPKALNYFGFAGDKKVLLIVGGSSGSLAINNAITGLLPHLCEKFDVLHLSGKASKPMKKVGYRKVPFLEDMSLAYSACDVSVSRAGAGACFELMSLKIPTLFIPLSKKASRGDQIVNANYFYEKSCCNVLFEENLTPYNLEKSIFDTYRNSDVYINNMKALKSVSGNVNIAKVIKKYGKN